MAFLLTIYALGCLVALVAGHHRAAPPLSPPRAASPPGCWSTASAARARSPGCARARCAAAGWSTVAKTTGTAARFIHPDAHRGAGLPQVRHRQRRRADRHRAPRRRVPAGRAGHRVHGGDARAAGGQPAQADPVHDRRAVQRPRGPPRRDGARPSTTSPGRCPGRCRTAASASPPSRSGCHILQEEADAPRLPADHGRPRVGHRRRDARLQLVHLQGERRHRARRGRAARRRPRPPRCTGMYRRAAGPGRALRERYLAAGAGGSPSPTSSRPTTPSRR